MAVVGAGYWGPNLVRNISQSPVAELKWVCDLDVARAARTIGRRADVAVTADVSEVLADPAVDAVAIATPSGTHLQLGLAALQAGKHVLIEKPLASTVDEGERLVTEAKQRGLVLMCDHTFCYTPVVRRLRELLHGGELGDLHYIDSTRVNLGLVQNDIDVFWDLAPHDLSVLDFILPTGCHPVEVAAHGADPLGTGHACVGYMTLPLSTGAIAHVTVNWLSPTKIRQTVVSGSKRMALWDDLKVGSRLALFDRGVDVSPVNDGEEKRNRMVSYRTGDVVMPALPETEALGGVVTEFAEAITESRPALTDGESGLRILRVLEAAHKSLDSGGAAIPLDVW
jgi:predicted dehydrogenase